MNNFKNGNINEDIFPDMSYLSMILPGILRGPHEHLKQIDYFCFVGTSNFKVVILDNKKESSTYNNKIILNLGENKPNVVIVPPGINTCL